MLSRFARLTLPLGVVCIALGLGVRAGLSMLLGAKLLWADDSVLRDVAKLRRPWLNGVAVDVTALGSGTLVALAAIVVIALLLTARDVIGAVHLAVAASGAGLITEIFKRLFARPRPEVVPHLVDVVSFSYPSGHALGTAAVYFNLAMIARRYMPRHASREILVAVTLAMIAVIGASRIYLGVHYLSDVLAGLLIGIGWSLVLAGLFSALERSLTGRSSVIGVAESTAE